MGQVNKALVLPLLCLCWGERLVIPEPHNNCALQCQLRLWKMLETSLRLLFGTAHPQKGVPWAHHQEGHRSPGCKPSGGGGNSSCGSSSKATPKKNGKAATTNSQGSSATPASQSSPCRSRRRTSHHHKSHKKDAGEKRKRAGNVSPARKGAGHRAPKDGGHC